MLKGHPDWAWLAQKSLIADLGTELPTSDPKSDDVQLRVRCLSTTRTGWTVLRHVHAVDPCCRKSGVWTLAKLVKRHLSCTPTSSVADRAGRARVGETLDERRRAAGRPNPMLDKIKVCFRGGKSTPVTRACSECCQA